MKYLVKQKIKKISTIALCTTVASTTIVMAEKKVLANEDLEILDSVNTTNTSGSAIEPVTPVAPIEPETSIDSVGQSSFDSTSKVATMFKYDDNDNPGVSITIRGFADGFDYASLGGVLDIPETIDGLPVTEIADMALANKGLTQVNFSNNIVTIGAHAFHANSLTSVIIPDSVQEIKMDAFSYNTNLTDLTLGNSVKTIGDNAFFYTKVNSLVVPDSVTYIGVSAFYNIGIETLTLGNGITEIANTAFLGNKITDLVIPHSLTKLGENVFTGNPIERIEFLGNSNINIQNAFYNLIGQSIAPFTLLEVIVPANREIIMENIFSNSPFYTFVRTGDTSNSKPAGWISDQEIIDNETILGIEWSMDRHHTQPFDTSIYPNYTGNLYRKGEITAVKLTDGSKFDLNSDPLPYGAKIIDETTLQVGSFLTVDELNEILNSITLISYDPTMQHVSWEVQAIPTTSLKLDTGSYSDYILLDPAKGNDYLVANYNDTASYNRMLTDISPYITPVYSEQTSVIVDIDKIFEGDNVVTGTGEPGANITVTLPDGSEVTGTVDENGNWTIDLPINLGGGDEITVTQDVDGNVSTDNGKAIGTLTPEVTPLPKEIDDIEVDKIIEGDDSISGTGEPGAEITVTLPDGSEITGEVDENGNWTIDLPINLGGGDEITVTQDVDGDDSTVDDISTDNSTVIDTLTPSVPVIPEIDVDTDTDTDTEIDVDTDIDYEKDDDKDYDNDRDYDDEDDTNTDTSIDLEDELVVVDLDDTPLGVGDYTLDSDTDIENEIEIDIDDDDYVTVNLDDTPLGVGNYENDTIGAVNNKVNPKTGQGNLLGVTTMLGLALTGTRRKK